MNPFLRLTLRPTVLTFTLALLSSTSACVTTGTFDKKVAELDNVRARGTTLWSRETACARSLTMQPRWLASSLHGSRSWGRMSAS
jgi:hypothetical protein